MLTLDIAPDLQFPIDAVTQKFAWLGRSGGGKTYGLKRFVEQMLSHGVQVVVLDSVGVWSGLRLGPDAFDVPIIGGLYGDIPLEPTSGALVAEVAVSHGSSMVLDTSQMIDAQRSRFCEAFGRRLFELKKITPGAMHVVLDEGQDVVPQNPNEGEKMMLHEWVRIAKQGRAFGIGLSISSQRPQEVNKKALNQAECVVAFQLTGSHERKAVEYWLADKGVAATKLSDTLTTLDIGRPFVWSPQWLKISRIIERILPIRSADTSKTPQFGDAPVTARSMRPIDLGALRSSMAAATEEAKVNDPKALRARIKELEAMVGAGPAAVPVVVFDKKKAEKLSDSYNTHIARTQQLVQWEHQELREIFDRIEKLHRNAPLLEQHLEANTLAEDLGAFLEELRATTSPKAKVAVRVPAANQAPAPQPPPERSAHPPAGGIPPGEAAMLGIVMQKKGGATDAYVILCTGYRKGSVTSYASRLTSRGLITRKGSRSFATAEAFKTMPAPEPLPTGAKLIGHYVATLPPGEALVVSHLYKNLGRKIDTDKLVKLTGRPVGSVTSYVSRLRTREIVVGKGHDLSLNPELGL